MWRGSCCGIRNVSLAFPLYVTFFPPNQAYAVFGIFLLFTFWLYIFGCIIVLGAELNAFLEQPARAVALSAATAAALHGQPTSYGAAALPGEPASYGAAAVHVEQPEQAESVRGPSLAGRVLGLLGLLVAVMLLRGRTAKPTDQPAGI